MRANGGLIGYDGISPCVNIFRSVELSANHYGQYVQVNMCVETEEDNALF